MANFSMLQDIKGYINWRKTEIINKGWSEDQKFYIEDLNGKKMLLRLSDISKYKAKEEEYQYLKKIKALEINSSKPLDFGICGDGQKVYSLLSWVEGEDANVILQNMREGEQYQLGLEAGELLNKIHSIPAPEGHEEWNQRYRRKIQIKLDQYMKCPIKINKDDGILRYIEETMVYLKGRPTTFQHGDYHLENLVVNSEKKVGVIDFNRMDLGDPWEEFNRIHFSSRLSIPFAIGQIHGYFNNNVPDCFFRLMALYISINTISSISWAMPFGQEEVDFMVGLAQEVVNTYDGMETYIPVWYREPEDCKLENRELKK